MSTSLHGCIHQQLNNARKLCQITIRLKHRSTPLLFAIFALCSPQYLRILRGATSVINHLFLVPQ